MTALVQKPFHNLKKIKHRNERRAEEKKIRNKPEKPPTDVELVGLTVVKIKQDDEVARRMKQWGNINNISPQFLPHYNRPSDTHSRPPDHMQPPPTHLHPSAARPPSSAAVSEQPRGRSSADNGAAGAMSGGSTGSEHKDKKHKKDKRKASSHSEERPLKKKSKDKDKDKEKDKEKEKLHSHLSAINKDGSGGAHSLGQPKKISQRSTSVSSDRSDHSTKTGTGRTSVDHKHSKHGHSGGGTGSSSKSSTKHPSSSGSKSSKNNISSHPNQGESASANNRHSSHLTSSAQGASSSKGAHHTEARLGSGSSGAGGSANDMNSESYTKNLLNSKSSGKDSTTQHINGLIRTKPTNLVIPSATKPTNPVPPTQHNTSSSADKDDSDVSRLLEKMVNPGFEKLGQIQTPVKSDMKYEYPIEPPPSLSNNYTTTKIPSKSNSSKHNNSSSNSHAESKDRGSTSTNNNKLSPIKISKIPVVQQNGVENDLKLSPSASDSDGEDSGSSSDSSSGSSSSSSSSSGSDSDSDSDADNTTTKSPPKLFHNLQPSPAPANRFNEEEKKDPWSLEKLMSKPAVTSTAAPSASAAPSQSKTSTTSTGSTQKRGRGRPKKNDNNKKNDDPDFTPGVIPGKQAPPVTTPTVTTDRSKRKKPGSEDPPKKRGRPPKNKPKEQDPKPLSSLSSDESSNHAHFATLPEPSSGSAKPSSMSGVPKLPLNEPGSRTAGSAGTGASTGAWGEDEDVDVEVTDSPHSHKSSFQPVPKTELHNKPSVKLKPEPLPLPTKITSILPKHEPISPVEDTPVRFPHLAFSSTTAPPPLPSGYRPPGMPAAPVVGRTTAPGTNSRPHRGDMDSITSLPFSIPLHKLRRNPAITPLRSIKAEKHMPIPSLPGIKQEPTSPSGKKRTKPMSPLDTLLFIKNKRPKPEVKTPDDEPCSPFINNSSISQKNNHMPRPPPLHSGHNTGHKDISRSIPPPAYDEPQFGYETARSLKKQATALGADITKGINTDQKAKVERLLLSLESVINFLVSGLGQETGKQPSVKKIRTYYRNTLDLATQLFDEITRESNIQPRSIFQCSQVLCNYTIAHLKHKCFKLTKDTMSVSGRRIQDQVKQKLSISPAITGNSPAPSPASIASTGSVTSDGGRGSSMPPSGPVIGVPESLLKDVSEFIKNQNFLSEAVDLWRNTNLCREHDLDTPEFFQMLEEDLGYKAEFLLESRQFIHFVHTACKKLQAKLHSS